MLHLPDVRLPPGRKWWGLCYCYRASYKSLHKLTYRGANKSLARPGRKQANVSVRIAWISFGALPCRKKKWQLASPCCRNRARPWHASELVSFLVRLRTYQHPGTWERHAGWKPNKSFFSFQQFFNSIKYNRWSLSLRISVCLQTC